MYHIGLRENDYSKFRVWLVVTCCCIVFLICVVSYWASFVLVCRPTMKPGAANEFSTMHNKKDKLSSYKLKSYSLIHHICRKASI